MVSYSEQEARQMKIGGLIGGVSWHSTNEIYEAVNNRVNSIMGDSNCAKLIVVNVNLQEILDADSKEKQASILAGAAERIELAGGDFVALCSNGLHMYAEDIQKTVNIPLIHIADVTADAIKRAGFSRAGLIGVRETMEEGFYRNILSKNGIESIIPGEEDRAYIDNILFSETCHGIIREESCRRFYEIADDLMVSGAECVIMGCTEVGMLMKQADTKIPLFDTATLHAERIAELCAGVREI